MSLSRISAISSLGPSSDTVIECIGFVARDPRLLDSPRTLWYVTREHSPPRLIGIIDLRCRDRIQREDHI